MVAPESNIANIQSDSVMHNAQNNFPFNPLLPLHSARPDDTVYNIQWGLSQMVTY